MYAILLVDDEPGHLIGLSKLIRRWRPHYEVFTAKNGQEALSLCKTVPFHLIITDIQMPILDGLHFAEQLPEGEQPRRVIYLTGYNYFEYAQKAIGLGTFDYVLKPIDIEHFVSVLERAEKSLQEERNRWQERSTMAAALESIVPVYQNRILTEWLLDRRLNADVRADLEEKIGIPEEGYLMVCRLQGLNDRKDWEIDRHRMRIRQWLQDELHRSCQSSLAFAPDHDRQIIVALIKDEPNDGQLEAWACGIGELLDRGEVRLGLSGRGGRFMEEAPGMFAEALAACEEGFYTEGRSVFRYAAARFRAALPIPVDPKEECSITEALHKQSGYEGLKQAIDAVIDRQLGKGAYPRPSDFKEWIIRLLCRVAEAADFLGLDTRAQLVDKMTAMSERQSLHGLREAAADRLVELAAAIAEARKVRKEHTIHDCLAYIDAHYMDDLSLESVAAIFHFNASYFSQYFKSKLNVNFSQYLTQVRLAKAKDLLEQSDERVYRLAERLGYHDVKYFNRVFKKEFGLTPEEYRSIARRMKQLKS
ncbi:response regulator transcription factor [Paenibacillus methanolicus]|uniref:Two-component system response regulator YesN n=1 Tax=Paenibacillus methanolicus TaxID=582686 RepID=A0A5S5CGT8_9BACL|nr:response regulator [Paenibacillus methanolicus]TYP78932.1 two-component system response regulator YesN [Paenibacillus methanolicus]